MDQSPFASVEDLALQGAMPSISEESRPFWDGLRDGQVLVEQCTECGLHCFPPRGICRQCLSRENTWVRVEPPARIVSYTVNHHAWSVGNERYTIVIAECPQYSNVRFVGFFDGVDRVPAIGDLVGFGLSEAMDGLPRLHFTPWEER